VRLLVLLKRDSTRTYFFLFVVRSVWWRAATYNGAHCLSAGNRSTMRTHCPSVTLPTKMSVHPQRRGLTVWRYILS
jgi:hypothetical protein